MSRFWTWLKSQLTWEARKKRIKFLGDAAEVVAPIALALGKHEIAAGAKLLDETSDAIVEKINAAEGAK